MSGPIRRVRIDRLVLRDGELEAHDVARLPQLIATSLEAGRPAPDADRVDAGDVHDLAGAIARGTVAALKGRRTR